MLSMIIPAPFAWTVITVVFGIVFLGLLIEKYENFKKGK
jgi:heme/copper-type cytochrome/quinol oxidase subunit 3